MNVYREDKPCCYLHPKEVTVGVCPLCLNERLLILASRKGYHHLHQSAKSSSLRSHSFAPRKPPITLPKIFAIGSLLNRFEFRNRKSENYDSDATTTHDDSFISIKFEDNGVASWEKGKVSKVSLEHCSMSWNHSLNKEAKGGKTVVEHATPRAPLRWRKPIGHLFQLIRWKRSNKGSGCHVSSKLEGVKVRKGWIRSLTKRRTGEE
ncbi:hypothetical protein RJ639_045868 [Escallonia herrerae]|uniref:Uncharacterized protein n=1 Tax=Escallonia herrerae TaxID=1293975 RepID=A0AA88WFH2_9ASTE|nr:hypothetical protein RJ639_045868 [Escallonia herrerae]